MTELVKIGQLASRAGVSKSTVQHYIREGLLPPAEKKPHKNMAYYRVDLVDRIKLIKELQKKRHLPLSTIKKIIKNPQAIADIRASLFQEPATIRPDSKDSVSRERLMEATGLTDEEIENLADHGFIPPNAKTFNTNDAAIVHAVASMRRHGFSEDRGFTVKDMSFYMDAMKNLVHDEVMLFMKRLGTSNPEQVTSLARAGVEGTNLLLMALRRKIFLDLLEGKSDLFTASGQRRQVKPKGKRT